jgi:putative transcriptional regulator
MWSKAVEGLMMTGASIQIGGAGLLALLWLFSPPTQAARTPGEPGPTPNLTGHLLVATPDLDDPNFRHTVVYMIQDDSSGAMGLVVNRVLGKGPAADLLKGLGLDANPKASGEIEVHYGGPVERGRGFVLHSPEYHGKDTVVLSDLVALTSSPDILEDLAAGKGPRHSLFALGYAGWAPDQLAAEIAAGAWVVIDADEKLLFGDQEDSKWQRALDRQGIEL